MQTGARVVAEGYLLIHRQRETGPGIGFWNCKTSPVKTLPQKTPKNSNIFIFIFLFKPPHQPYVRRSQERLCFLPACPCASISPVVIAAAAAAFLP